MPGQLMIYGATGYTGKLLAQRAKAMGLRPILAGRDSAKLTALAEPLGFACRTARLDEPEQLRRALSDVAVVLNAAGPFSATARPVADACLRTGAHYLDVTGEIAVFAALARRDAEARAANVMVMPGVGFVVVPSDCLAAHVAGRLPGARRLRIGISRTTLISRGSAKTLIELLSREIEIRRDGRLTSVPFGRLERAFDYGHGMRTSVALSWADVFTAYHTTGIPNVEVYLEVSLAEKMWFSFNSSFAWLLKTAPWQALLKAQTDLLPEGPADRDRAVRKRVIVAEAEDAAGRRVCSRLVTPEAYTFTLTTALAIAERVLAGDVETGFRTPARLYGADFVLTFGDVVRQDMDP